MTTDVSQTEAPTLDLPALYSALDSAHSIMAFHSRDWGRHANDAWLWGILAGWDGDPEEPGDEGAWSLLADRHGWDADTLDRLKTLRAAVAGFTINAVGDLMRLEEERDEARSSLGRVRAVHRQVECVNVRCEQGSWCIGCDPDSAGDCTEYPWPCPTIVALDGTQPTEERTRG